MKNEIALLNEEDIKSKIYNIRGKEVMLDSDLAKLYGCKNGTKDINKAVKRNTNKFPEDFYFQLNEEECPRFHFGTLNIKRGQNIKYLPHVFTEEGVAMLSSVLKTDIANEVSVKIMRAFVSMRHILMNNLDYHKELSIIQNKVLEHDNVLLEHKEKLLEYGNIINSFSTDDILKDKLIFKGSFYDAYSLILDIFSSAKKEIIIIDNYVDNKVLNMVSKLDIKLTIISSNMNNELINKYQKQYNNITIINDDSFHDRFIIIDQKTGYHLGSSIKDISKKISYIDTIDKKWINIILERTNKWQSQMTELALPCWFSRLALAVTVASAAIAGHGLSSCFSLSAAAGVTAMAAASATALTSLG